MWKCPICGNENNEEVTCSCGWTRVKDYLAYPTLCPIGEHEKESMAQLFKDDYMLNKGKEYEAGHCWEDAAKFFEKSAENGNLEAMKHLGYYAWKGLGTEKNLYRALRWYSKVMEAGEEDVSEALEAIYEEIKNGKTKGSEEPEDRSEKPEGLPSEEKENAEEELQEKSGNDNDASDTTEDAIEKRDATEKKDKKDNSHTTENSEEENKCSGDGEAELHAAIAAYYQSDMRTAESFREFQETFKKAADEENPLAHVMLGLLYWRNYPYDQVYTPQAIEHLEIAMEQGCPLGGVWLAEILKEMRKADPGYLPERSEDVHTQAKLLGKVKLLAEQENAEALYWIAVELYKDEEYEEAVRWLNWAAEQEMPQAQGFLGICSYYGHGVEKDYDAAYTCFKQAERSNEGWVYRYLGDCCYYGYGTDQDKEQAAKYYEMGAVQCDLSALLKIAEMLQTGDGVPKNQKRAFQQYQKAADLGSVDGKREVGICFWYGKGVEKNFLKAEQAFRNAADRDDGLSQFMLGLVLLEENQGMPKEDNLKELQFLFESAAEQNVAMAYLWAARMRLFYTEDENDYRKGHQLLRKALEREETKTMAMNLLGNCYAEGTGVEQNPREAVAWYQKAADLNDPEGCLHLSQCYRDGIGVSKSSYEAEKWLTKAAKAGNAEAAFQLAKDTQKQFQALDSARRQVQEYAELAYQQGIYEAAVILAKNFWYSADYAAGKLTDDEKQELYQKADEYFRKAEEKNVPEARTERAYYYLKRFRNPKKEEGIAILQEEAGYKKPIAQYYLGLCYLKGIGVKKDKKLGKSYIRIAAGAGFEEAQDEVDGWLLG